MKAKEEIGSGLMPTEILELKDVTGDLVTEYLSKGKNLTPERKDQILWYQLELQNLLTELYHREAPGKE